MSNEGIKMRSVFRFAGNAPQGPDVLVTGFSAFPGMPVNPTQAMVERLIERRYVPHGVRAIRYAVIDVVYARLPDWLLSLAEEGCPDIALHFGVSSSATGFAIETVARNVVGLDRPDATGCTHPAAQIAVSGPATLASSLPEREILGALDRLGLPASASDDAGDYLCNFLLYHALHGICAPYAPPMAGFVHVPPLQTDGAFTAAMLDDGAQAILECCVECWRRRDA
jgi:pyroglutamyl-peptidase